MAEANDPLPDVFVVGAFTANSNELTLARGKDAHALEPRAFGVLRYLAERPGQLVTIDELMDALWPGVVVTPNAVTRVVAQLRKALGDDARDPSYIQTVSRSGYRFVAEVRPAPPAWRPRSPWRIASLAALVLLAIIAVWTWPRPPAPTVAVLPFENLTGNPDLGYLGDGVAEEVTHSLAQLPGLRVSARSVAFSAAADRDPMDAARALDVGFVVTGSVRQSGQQLRVTAQLVETDSGYNVWSHSEEHDPLAVFAAQDAISAGVTDALASALALETPETDSAAATPDPQAYDLYLRGRYIWHRRGTEPLQPAIDAFTEAVSIDPDFARGWAALASAYLTYPSYSNRGYATWHLAEDAARKALELDPGIPEVYGILATFVQYRGDWVRAQELFIEGIERDARSATAHYWYGEHLAKVGRYAEAVQAFERALSLDPVYLAPRADAAFAYLMFGDVTRGKAAFEDAWQAGLTNPVAWMGLFISQVLAGDYATARRVIELGRLPSPTSAALDLVVAFEAGEGTRDPAIAAVFDPASRVPYQMQVWLGARLGAHDAVFAMLAERHATGKHIDTRPLWGPGTDLHAQVGFLSLIDDLGLLAYWDEVAWGDICRRVEAQVSCDLDRLNPERLADLLRDGTQRETAD